jgi:hypothetical protein
MAVVLSLPLQASLSQFCFHHQNTLGWLIASVPHTFSNISALLPCFTQHVTHLCLKT